MSDTLPEWSYPDWPYERVMVCLKAEPQEVDGYRVYQDIPSSDFVVSRPNGTATLFFDGLNAINLPPALADAVRHDGSE